MRGLANLAVVVAAIFSAAAAFAQAGQSAQPASSNASALRFNARHLKSPGVNPLGPSSNLFRTLEARLKVGPLDPRKTIGIPNFVPPVITPPREPGHSAGGMPDPAAVAVARRLYPDYWQSGPVEGAPENAIGKLLTAEGWCSAAVVSSKNIIVTAAHCCWNRVKKRNIHSLTFIPAYSNGDAPFGSFVWRRIEVSPNWKANGNTESDVCVVELQNDSAGHPVTFYTGWLARSWNRPSSETHRTFGYAKNLQGGRFLETCISTSERATPNCGGDGVLETGCAMTSGSSGGPWLRDYGASNEVDAVTHGESCSTNSPGKRVSGPRFTSDNIVLVCNQVGGC